MIGYIMTHDHPLYYWWRANASYFWDWDWDGVCHVSIHYSMWYVLRRTPEGIWLTDVPPHYSAKDRELGKKIVYFNSRKKHAYPTQAEALDSLKHRTNRRLQYARGAYETAKKIQQHLASV